MHRLDGVTGGPTRIIRAAAWIVILAMAAFQAYAQRYIVGPDGIAYLDMSDGVVNGDWSRLINLYWSPLYPALIGVSRMVFGTSPAAEVPIVHLVNFLSFVAMFAAFDYMLASVRVLADRTRNSILGGVWGLLGAYVLFAFFAFTMIPLELTTPDLLSGAAMFVVFGALLRLRNGTTRATRDAVVLGVALGLGALTKSFMVPWAGVCLVVLAVASRSLGFRPALTAGAVWALIVLPWTLVLTRQAGRFTFGDTGRFTYAWYVNGQDAPSMGGVPPGARTATTDAILPGVGATGVAPGTDPMWYDPARWNAMLTPHWNLRQQLGAFTAFQLFYVQSLTPLLFFILLIATTPKGKRRDVWLSGWVVYIPAVAGIIAYSLVLVTARYVMPFVVAGTLTMLALLPRPRRMLPLVAVLGVVIPLGLEAMSNDTIYGLTLVAAMIAAMCAGALVPARSRLLWGIAVVLAFLVARVVLPPSAPEFVRMGALLVVVVFWFSARSAIRDGHPVRFAERASAALVLVLFVVFGLRFKIRVNQDLVALGRAASPTWGNVQQRIATDLTTRGIGPGTRIALVGPHAESYWARTGRLTIVANVPRTHADAFWRLSTDAQNALLREFAAAGATVVVASMGPSGGQPDSTWTPVHYRGWIRPLTRPESAPR